MKIFEIMDEENNSTVGTLIYYEKAKTFVVELEETLDEWSAPLLFMPFVQKKIFTIPRNISLLWVQERIIPANRQNISSILTNHQMQQYDEMKFLEISEGRCSQDHLYVRQINSMPRYVEERMKHNLVDCIALANHNLLCIFQDHMIKKVDLPSLEYDGIDKILKNDPLYDSCSCTVGGYAATFYDSIDIPALLLYQHGQVIPLHIEDLYAFVQKNVIDSSEASDILGCSRQNVHYLTQKKIISPIKKGNKTSLYLKGEIQKHTW